MMDAMPHSESAGADRLLNAGSAVVPGTTTLDTAMRYSFSGHQTFPFRYAWPWKGVHAVSQDSEVFRRPDALARLGVGKNMVASIRHWGEALDLFEVTKGRAELTRLGRFLFTPPPPPPRNCGKSEQTPQPAALEGRATATGSAGLRAGADGAHDREAGGARRNSAAQTLFPEHGEGPGHQRRGRAADPYLEAPGTLWLLHWRLVSRPGPASTWHLVFTRFAETVFTRDELAAWLVRVASESARRRTSPASIRRDLDVFLRTYLPSRPDARRPLEDGFDCPLVELGLLERVGPGRFVMRRSPRPSLPDEILLFATLEFWQRTAPDLKTLPLERLLFDAGSPGAAFRLGDKDLARCYERLSGSRTAPCGFRYDETAGMRLLLSDGSVGPARDPFGALGSYYGGGRS